MGSICLGWSSGFWLPQPVFLRESVSQDEDFSCDGDECYFFGFSVGDEALVEQFEFGVVRAATSAARNRARRT